MPVHWKVRMEIPNGIELTEPIGIDGKVQAANRHWQAVHAQRHICPTDGTGWAAESLSEHKKLSDMRIIQLHLFIGTDGARAHLSFCWVLVLEF